MKLRNRKTGEIATLTLSTNGEDMIIMGNDMYAHITKLSELKDYEDYEEPKEYWYINEFGTPTKADFVGRETLYDKCRKNFGNYFSSREEAEKAVRKLKAWKRLRDKGFKLKGWYMPKNTLNIEIDGGFPEDVSLCDVMDDLDIFGGEE